MRKWLLGACFALTMVASSGCATYETSVGIEKATTDEATRGLLKVLAYPVTVPLDIALLPIEVPVTAVIISQHGLGSGRY